MNPLDEKPAALVDTARMGGEWRQNWKLVLACFFGFSFFSFMTASIGVFMKPLGDEFGWSRTLLSSGVTIAALTTALLSPVCGVVIDRFGPRRVALPGLVATMVAICAFSLVNGSPVQWMALWAFYAVISISVKTTVWISAVARVFEKGRGLALGVTLCGTAAAQSIAPPLGEALISEFGWRMAYLFLGLGWGLTTLALSALFLHDDHVKIRKAASGDQPQAQPVQPAAQPARLPGLTVSEAMRDTALWRIAIATLLVMALTMGLAIHLFPILEDAGVPRSRAAALLSLIGVSGIVGKLVTGVLLDRYKANWLGGISIGIASLAFAFLLDGIRTPTLIVIALVLSGYSAGTKIQIASYLTARYAGLRNFGAIYGILTSIVAVATGIGPMLAAMAYDYLGGYSSFLIAGSIGCLLSGILIATLPAYPEWADEAGSGTRTA